MFLLFPLTAFSQNGHPILSEFFAIQDGKTVILDWTIKGGNTCQGIRIERFSEELQGFERIGEYDGVCGSTENDERYQYVDTSPLPNQINLYRLELGQQGYTNVLAFEFYAYNDDNYVLLGNPVIDRTQIIFENPLNANCIFESYDLNGRLVFETQTSGNKVDILKGNMEKGVYVFRIRSEDGINIKGKLLVQ